MTQGRGNVIDFDDIFGMALPNSNPQNANGKASGTSIKKQLFKSGTALRRISNSARTKAKENIEKSISTLLTKSDNGGVVDKVKPAIESLTSHANSFIISELTNRDDYKNTVSKLEQCKINIEKFTKVKDWDEVNHWKMELANFRKQLAIYKEMMSVHSTRNSVSDSRILRASSRKSSPEVVAAQYKLDCIKAQMREKSPSYLVNQMRELREQMRLRDLFITESVPDFDELFDNDGFDENEDSMFECDSIDENITETVKDEQAFDNCPDRILMSKYNNLCLKIAELLNCTQNEVYDTKLGTLMVQLKNCLTGKDDELLEQYSQAQLELMTARSALSRESYGVCEYIYDHYDLNNPVEETKVRELLASIYIRVVKGIAYNIVSKRNKLHMYEEAVGYGLVGLTMAINKWVARQKSEPKVCIEFKGLCNTFVANAIKSGFTELVSLGTASTSHIQHQSIILNKRIDNFIRFNPQFKNADREELMEMLADDDSFVGRVSFMYESTYDDISATNQRDEGELWTIVTKSNDSLEQYTESKHDYQLLIKSIKELLNLFETTKDVKTGETRSNGRKLFDRYETRLFEMTFGFVWKKNSMLTGNGQYNQLDMANELKRMYAEQGINKTFTQPAVASRINTLKKKIQFAVENNKKLKRAFEYIQKRWNEDPEYLLMISNEREASGETFCPPPAVVFKRIEERHKILEQSFEESPLALIEKDAEENALSIFQPMTIR